MTWNLHDSEPALAWWAQEVALGRAAALCPHCAAGAPHHTNSRTSIGGTDRDVRYDLHEVEDASGVGLAECLAYDEVWRKVG